VFGAWPQFWDAQAGLTPAGLFWYGPATYFATGDKPWYHEFHWHGLQLIAGNIFVLAGLIALAALALSALRLWLRARNAGPGRPQGPLGAGLPQRPGLPQGCPGPAVSDESSLARIRERLAARVMTATGISSARIAAALREVPRHLFLPSCRRRRRTAMTPS